jgi:hypothetical protein
METENTQEKKMTLALGGTGKTGRRVVERLEARRVPTRVGFRSGEPPFDWEDWFTWTLALRDVGLMYVSYYPDLAVPVVLKRAEREHERAMVGRSDGAPVLTLGPADVGAAYERLRGLGVRFLGEPYRFPGGIGALLLDQDGNPILLRQTFNEERP